jgi:hypothetical protein
MLANFTLARVGVVVAALVAVAGSPEVTARAPIALAPQTSDYWPGADYDPAIPSASRWAPRWLERIRSIGT